MEAVKISRIAMGDVKRITSEGWSGEILQMSRDTFLSNKDNGLLTHAGAYVIYADHFDKQTYGSEIYIGQGDDVTQRLESHLTEKPFWNRVLIFTSAWMNVAYAFNVENKFIAAAKLANRYRVTNQNDGQVKKLGPEDTIRLTEYVFASIQAVELANIDIFAFNKDGLFFHRMHDLVGMLKITSFDPKQVVLLKGSTFPSIRITDEVIAANNLDTVIRKDGRILTFLDDVVITINEAPYNATLLSIRVEHFKNSCGVDLHETFNQAQRGRRANL